MSINNKETLSDKIAAAIDSVTAHFRKGAAAAKAEGEESESASTVKTDAAKSKAPALPLMLVVLGLLVAYVGPYQFAMSKRSSILDEKSQVESETERVETDIALAETASGDNYEQAIDTAAALRVALPSDSNTRQLIDQLAAAADDAGVIINSVSNSESSVSSGSTSRVEASVSVTGTPEAVFSFMEGLRDNPRIITVNTVRFAADSSGLLNARIAAAAAWVPEVTDTAESTTTTQPEG